jgi:hypothetical protein
MAAHGGGGCGLRAKGGGRHNKKYIHCVCVSRVGLRGPGHGRGKIFLGRRGGGASDNYTFSASS